MGEDVHDVGVWEMVQEAVDEDEIESLARWDAVFAGIGYEELTTMARSRMFDIARVEVDSQILAVGEVPGVGSGTPQATYSTRLTRCMFVCASTGANFWSANGACHKR